MQIDEAFVNSQAPNVAAIKNAHGVVIKKKLLNLCIAPDKSVIFGECKGSGSENYRTSADFADPTSPVYRCSCPSRQFPCKHTLALMYAYAQGMPFSEDEIPQDISEKRTKQLVRVEKKKSEAVSPPKTNTRALKKKIEAQIQGLALLESIVFDLVKSGLGSMNAKTALQIEEHAKQLGNAYLPGAKSALQALTGLFYRSRISSEDEIPEKERDKNFSLAIDQLNRLYSLCRQGSAYLQNRLDDPDLKQDTETEIAAWLGHAWQLSELKEAGLVQSDVELLQLAFRSKDDWTRQEYVDTGVWLNLNTGTLQLTHNYRPYRAAKYVKEEDSCFQIVKCSELCVYPGKLNPRVRWDKAELRPVLESDYRKAKELAETDLRTTTKTVKNHLKSPLGERQPIALLRFDSIGWVGDLMVLEDHQGERLILHNHPSEDEPDTLPLLSGLSQEHHYGQAMLVRFHHDLDSQRLSAKPLSILTDRQIIRLTF